MMKEDNDLTIAYMAGYHKAKGECKDDFQSRRCENCKWFTTETYYTDIHDEVGYQQTRCQKYHINYGYKYGCVDFERKEK